MRNVERELHVGWFCHGICAASSRGLDIDSLDGTAKGDGDTVNKADATCACGKGSGIVVESI